MVLPKSVHEPRPGMGEKMRRTGNRRPQEPSVEQSAGSGAAFWAGRRSLGGRLNRKRSMAPPSSMGWHSAAARDGNAGRSRIRHPQRVMASGDRCPERGDRCGSRIAGSLSGKMKSGMLYGHERESGTFDAFKRKAAGCVDRYSSEGIQGKTKWMPPSKFREASMSSLRYDSVNLSRKLGTYQTSPLLNEAD